MELGGTFEDDVIVEARDRHSTQQVVNYNVKVCSDQWFEEAQAVDQSDRIQILKYSAESAYRNQEFAKAVQHFQQALDLLPPNNTLMGRDMLESVARSLLSLGQTHHALAAAQRLHKASQNFEHKTDSLLLMVQIFSKLGNLSGEALALQACLTLHPDNPDLWIKLGQVYQQIKAAGHSRHEHKEQSTSVCNVDEKRAGEEASVDSKDEIKGDSGKGMQHDCDGTEQAGDNLTETDSKACNSLGVDHQGDFVPTVNELSEPHEVQTTKYTHSAQSPLQSAECISNKHEKEVQKDCELKVTDCNKKFSSYGEESKKNTQCRHSEQELATPNHREAGDCTTGQEGASEQEIESLPDRMDQMCLDSHKFDMSTKLDLDLVICTCLLRARLLLQNVQRTVTSFAKTRNQHLQEQVSERLKDLQIPQEIVEQCKKFMVKCVLEADSWDSDSQINVAQVDMSNENLHQEFERRWFSWIADCP